MSLPNPGFFCETIRSSAQTIFCENATLTIRKNIIDIIYDSINIHYFSLYEYFDSFAAI